MCCFIYKYRKTIIVKHDFTIDEYHLKIFLLTVSFADNTSCKYN